MKIQKSWKLPKPSKGPVYEWFPLVRMGSAIPFGYYEDPEDPHILRPIPEELELLEKAKSFIKEYPMTEVAAWLSEQSGRDITPSGLKKRIKLERKHRKDASNARFYAKRYKEAAEKAKKLEEGYLGGEKTRRVVSE